MFTKHLFRCSSLGHILVGSVGITDKQRQDIDKLTTRNIKASRGEEAPLTDNMRKELSRLCEMRDAPDELSAGVKTHLDDIFRSVFWKRKRLLSNKYLTKGLWQEEDSLDVVSYNDGKFLAKNKIQYQNDYIQGMPDVAIDIVTDTKTSWDMDTFDNAELTNLYEWQINGYMWLTGLSRGRIVYCLVNAPLHLVQSALLSLYYQHGQPNQEDGRKYDKWKEEAQQLERNMIFDIPKFQEDNPGYEWENTELNFSIPMGMRQKSFEVQLEDGDIEFIKTRVVMCRTYLQNKYLATMQILNELVANQNKNVA